MFSKIASSLVVILLLAWTVGLMECAGGGGDGTNPNKGNPKDKGKAPKNPMEKSQNTGAGRADQNTNDPEKGSDAEMEEKMPPPQEGQKDGTEKGRKRKHAGVMAPNEIGRTNVSSNSTKKRISQTINEADERMLMEIMAKELEGIPMNEKFISELQTEIKEKFGVDLESNKVKEEIKQILELMTRTQAKLVIDILEARDVHGQDSDQPKELTKTLKKNVIDEMEKAEREDMEKAKRESLLTHPMDEQRRSEMAGGASSSAHHAAGAHLTPQNHMEGVKKEEEEVSTSDSDDPMQIRGHRHYANVKLEPKEEEEKPKERGNGKKEDKKKDKKKKDDKKN